MSSILSLIHILGVGFLYIFGPAIVCGILSWIGKFILSFFPKKEEISHQSKPVSQSKAKTNQANNASLNIPKREISAQKINAKQYQSPTNQYTPKILTSTQTNQQKLFRWEARNKDNVEIGRDYERFIGYQCERRGFFVEYMGGMMGVNDNGQDLIVRRHNEIYVVQCKYRRKSKGSLIHINTIHQIFGSTEQLRKKHAYSDYRYHAVLVTNVSLDSDAREAAEDLSVLLYENVNMVNHPMVKCFLSDSGERIYHLPFDKTYDYVRIGGREGCFYTWTVEDAESKGFRHIHSH